MHLCLNFGPFWRARKWPRKSSACVSPYNPLCVCPTHHTVGHTGFHRAEQVLAPQVDAALWGSRK